MKIMPRFETAKCFLLLLFTLTFTTVLAQKRAGQPFTIVQMSDPQFGFTTNNKDFVVESANFERAIKATNKLNPQAVFITGDLVHRIQDSVQIAEYKRIVSLLDPSIPVYVMPGNHDLPDHFTREDLAKYKSDFGKDYYDVKTKSVYSLVLNSQMIASGSMVQKEYQAQYEWLQKKLKKAKKKGYKHILVFQHHPYFVKNLEEKDEYFNIPIQVRQDYLDLFHKSRVNIVFSGHLHYNLINHYKDIELVTTGPLSVAFHNQDPGVRVLNIEGDRLKHQFYSLDEFENL